MLKKLGMGTWHLGEGSERQQQQQLATLRYGLEHGVSLIDTAEMYGEGAAETLVGKAIQPYDRSRLTLISKFYPWHAAKKDLRQSLTATLKRLHTDYLDLYLLHWRQKNNLTEMVANLEELKKQGLIRQWGVSNFDVSDLKELLQVPAGNKCFVNEDLYNLGSRGVETDLLAFQKQHQIDFIAYSPFGSENSQYLKIKPQLRQLAGQKKITIHQLLLAWVLQQDVYCIPKASSIKHLQENLAAATVTFSDAELQQLDKLYPRPTNKAPLDMI